MLTQRSLNYFQQWALMYWLYLDRRTTLEDRQAELEGQTFNLFPERWSQLYQDKTLASLALEDGDEGFEAPVTDIDALDAWYEQMVAQNAKRFAGGGDSRAEEWGDWQ